MKTARQLNIEHLVHVRDSTEPQPFGTQYYTAPFQVVMHAWTAKKHDFTELNAVMNSWSKAK